MDETTMRNTSDMRPDAGGTQPADQQPQQSQSQQPQEPQMQQNHEPQTPHTPPQPPVPAAAPAAAPAASAPPPASAQSPASNTVGGWSSPGGTTGARDPWTTRPLPAAPSSAAGAPATTATTELPTAAHGGPQTAVGGSGGYPPPPGHADGFSTMSSPGAGDAGGTGHAAPTAEPPKPAPRRARTWLAALAIGAIIGGGAGAATATWLDDDDATTGPTSSLNTSDDDADGSSNQAADSPVLSDVGEVADQVLPSVVSIENVSPAGQTGGSGVIISSDGQILTNNHVAEGGDQGRLTVTFSDGSTAEATVIGTDPLTDLAVIQAQDVSDLTPATLGSSSDVTVGQQVVAIGSPLGLDGTVTTGIVSALDRTVEAGDSGGRGEMSIFSAIQTDAPINPGNSGGALVNMAGEVIGINSAILTTGTTTGSIGLGFSIPIDQAKPIAEELIETGKATHARIGVEVGTPQDGTRGALIGTVVPDSAAAEAGIQEGDIVTRVDDRVITDGTSLVAVARSYRPGDEVTLTILRDGEEITLDLTLGSDAQTT